MKERRRTLVGVLRCHDDLELLEAAQALLQALDEGGKGGRRAAARELRHEGLRDELLALGGRDYARDR